MNLQSFSIDKCNYLHLNLDNYVKYKIIVLYWNLNNNFNDFIHNFKQYLSKTKSNNLIVLGNINIDISNDSNDINKFEYLDCMAELGLYQCISNFIRVTENSASFIDHIFIRTNTINNIVSFIYCYNWSLCSWINNTN